MIPAKTKEETIEIDALIKSAGNATGKHIITSVKTTSSYDTVRERRV